MQQNRFGLQPTIALDSDTKDWGKGLTASAMITR